MNLGFQNGFYKATSGLDAAGAIALLKGVNSCTIDSCSFTGNYTNNRHGGALWIELLNTESITIRGCTFSGNKALNGKEGGAIGLSGGTTNGAGVLRIIGCRFENNTSEGIGGALKLTNGVPNILLEGCEFIGNSCSYQGNPTGVQGGGAVHDNAGAKYYNCLFKNNMALGESTGGINAAGGAICNTWAMSDLQVIELVNCVFDGNTAEKEGGAIRCDDPVYAVNCTFVNNKADANENATGSGGAMYVTNSVKQKAHNCIFWKNYKATTLESLNAGISGKVSLLNSALDDINSLHADYNRSTLVSLSASPLKNIVEGDYSIDNLHGASCLNAGSEALLAIDSLDVNNNSNTSEAILFDFDNQARIQFGIPDLGAYESPWAAFIDLSGVDYDLSEAIITGTLTTMEYCLNSTDGSDGTWVACSNQNTSAALSLNGGFKIWVRQASAAVNLRLVGDVPTWNDRLTIAIATIPEPLNPTEDTDINVFDMADALVSANRRAAGFQVQSGGTFTHPAVSSPAGIISYLGDEQSGTVKLLVTNGQGVEQLIERTVVVPRGMAYSQLDQIIELLPTALTPVEGIDANLTDMLNAIALDLGLSGLSASVENNSANPAIALSGDIAYGAAESKGKVQVEIALDNATRIVPLYVIVPQSAFAHQLSAASLTLPDTLRLYEGWDVNLPSVVSRLLLLAGYSDITVSIVSTENTNIGANGTISYSSETVKGDVNLKLELGDKSLTVEQPVVVTASILSAVSNSQDLSLRVYPNPAVEYIVVEGLEAGSELRLYSGAGCLLMCRQCDGSSLVLDVSAIHGHILLLVRGTQGVRARRILVK